MVTSVFLYIDSATSQRIPTRGAPTSGGTTVTLNVVSISNNYSELVGDLIITPGPGRPRAVARTGNREAR